MQTTATLLMVRPAAFGYNEQTAINNAFQAKPEHAALQDAALQEFDNFVTVLQNNGIDVLVINDTPLPRKPDAIFPNNWFSTHQDGTLFLYPMFAPNRRLERVTAIIDLLKDNYVINKIVDYSGYEAQGIFMEGTGSMVLDREHKLTYACLSARTQQEVIQLFCTAQNYQPVCFDATGENGIAIYHTNVLMCVADRYVVICLDGIKDMAQKEALLQNFKQTDKEIIAITEAQMNSFAGNMLQVHNRQQEKLLVMSTRAYESLTPEQIATINGYNRIVHAPLYTIENAGGGSARCMLAEIFLQKKA